jgi:glutathione S-transferase
MSDAAPLGELHAEALARLEQALATRPVREGDAFTAATQALSRYREALIRAQADHPASGDRDRLSKLSAVIAMVIAGHYPLGVTVWEDLEKARDWFVELTPVAA